MDNFEDDQELQRCGGCGRRFERRAALTSHSQICQKRIAARKVKVNNNLQGAPDKVPQKLTADLPRVPVVLDDVDDDKCVLLDVTQRIRHSSVSNWSDVTRKEVPGKRIEIQIRRDYCKPGSSSSSVNNPYNSPGRPQTPADVPEPNLIKLKEEIMHASLEEEETSQDFNEARILNNVIKANILCSDAVSSDMSSRCNDNGEENSVLDSCEKKNDTKLNDEMSDLKSKFKRRQTNVDIDRLHGTRSNSVAKKRRITDGISKSSKISKSRKSGSVEEILSPAMEKRMQSFINLKRLQCLPCQKKFHKLTNLRRHVAVHIGWNRYKCTVCTFKCFAKYDCVNHIVKIHNVAHERAQEMVSSIETHNINLSHETNAPVINEGKNDFIGTSINNVKNEVLDSVNEEIKLVPIVSSTDVVTEAIMESSSELKDANDAVPNCKNEVQEETHKISNATDSFGDSGESVEMNYSDETYSEHPEMDGFIDNNLDNEINDPGLEHEGDPVNDATSEVSDLESIEQQQSDVSINGGNKTFHLCLTAHN